MQRYVYRATGVMISHWKAASGKLATGPADLPAKMFLGVAVSSQCSESAPWCREDPNIHDLLYEVISRIAEIHTSGVAVRVGDRRNIVIGDVPSPRNSRDTHIRDRRALYVSREVRIPLVRYGRRYAALRRRLLPCSERYERFVDTTIRVRDIR
jgi:hypothetical protein